MLDFMYPPSRKDLGSVSTMEADRVTFNFAHFSCSFDAGKGIPHLPDIAKFFSSHLFDSIATSLQPLVATAITSALEGGLSKAGVPRLCEPRSVDVET